MNYHLKSSNFQDRKRNEKKKLLITIFSLVVLLLIISTSPVRSTLFSVALPVWKIQNYIVNSNFFEYFKSKQTLINERLIMEQKLFLAGNLIDINNTLEAENENLKDLLGRRNINIKSILAKILVKPPQTPYDLLIVDIGSDLGVKVGDKVVANTNIYIGEVSEVFPQSSKITLYSTPGETIPVVLGINSISVEAVGIGGGNFNIFLPREVEVKEGDVIIIPIITANVFGIVEKIIFKETDSFQTVLFKSPVNISELSFVEIVL